MSHLIDLENRLIGWLFFYCSKIRGDNLIDFLKKKGRELMEAKKEKKDEKKNLMRWQDKFNDAFSKYDLNIMDERELLYLGTRELDQNINEDTKSNKKANNTYNICYEFVESMVDPSIPLPSVTPKRFCGFTQDGQPYSEYLASKIESSIKNDLLDETVNILNDESERITPIQGLSIITAMWNPDVKHHLYKGDIEIKSKHPKCLIPQSGVWNIQDMDYFFLLSSETKLYAKRRYGVDLSDEGESHPEINSITGYSGNSSSDSQIDEDDIQITSGKVTIITAWYKDEDGDIGKFTWCNDKILEDMPKFFYRRLEDGEVQTEEILPYDIMLNKVDENGQPIIIPMGTVIPLYYPKKYPVVIRKNVPLAFQFGGQSDIDIIRDQQDAIKRVGTAIEEKIQKGGSIIKVLENHNVKLTNKVYQIVEGSMAELQALGSEKLAVDIQQDIVFMNEQYKMAQNMLGITDSYQGKPDPTAQSGVAKMIQVNQSSSRLQSRQINKRTSYKQLAEIMFELRLAYYDEERPIVQVGSSNKYEYDTFNRYDFLEQDAAGEWFYNTDFIFAADAGDGLPKEKIWLMQKVENYQALGLLNPVQFWTALDKLGFPGATEFKKQAMEQQQKMEMMGIMTQIPNQNSGGTDPQYMIPETLQGLQKQEYMDNQREMGGESV